MDGKSPEGCGQCREGGRDEDKEYEGDMDGEGERRGGWSEESCRSGGGGK